MDKVRENPNRTQQLSSIGVRQKSSGKLMHLEVAAEFKKKKGGMQKRNAEIYRGVPLSLC